MIDNDATARISVWAVLSQGERGCFLVGVFASAAAARLAAQGEVAGLLDAQSSDEVDNAEVRDPADPDGDPAWQSEDGSWDVTVEHTALATLA